MTSSTFLIQRGTAAESTVPRKDIVKILDDESLTALERYDEIKKLVAVSTSLDCADIVRAVTFKVIRRSVRLHSFRLFGPAAEEVAEYDLTIVISEIQSENPTIIDSRRQLVEIRQPVRAKKGELIAINLDNPVIVHPDTWYRIAFRLNGPPTAVCSSADIKDDIVKDGVQFQFYNSSKQLPVLEFSRR